MAITITKEPTGIYPAYNNSYIEFSSDLADNNRAAIVIDLYELFDNAFIIYPDSDGTYLFNLKDVAIGILNNTTNNSFRDLNVFTNAYSKSISGLISGTSVRIHVYNNSANEYIDRPYVFYKGGKQIGENISTNNYRIASYSKDGVNHKLTYYEGFPFHFDIFLATANEEITLKSLNTNDEYKAMPTISDGFRINIDKGGGSNFTNDNILPLITGINKLEIWSGGTFKTNLLLNKKKQCSGIYLKWFNSDNGYNFHLFDRYFTENTKTDEIGIVFNDDFQNVGQTIGSYKSMGKNSYTNIAIRATFSEAEYEVLRSLFESPSVQMYTSQTAYVEGEFIDVSIDGDFPYNNKKTINKISFTVIPPKRITPIL